MTTPNDARLVIHNRVVTSWPAAEPTVPFTFTNESFDPTAVTEYLSVEMQSIEGAGHTIAPVGTRVFERRGLVFMQLFVAVDVGLLRLDALMKTARDLFEGLTLSGVYFFAADIREAGPVDGRFLGTVSIPFAYDEIR